MAWSYVGFDEFGGLDLVSSPDNSLCVDMLNIDLDVRGAIRARDGFDNFTSSELTNQPDSVFPFTTSAGTKRLLVGNGSRVDALNTSATSVDNEASTASPHFFVRFGGPTAEAVYFANGTDQVKKFTSDAFDTPAGLSGETGKFVAVTPVSNRLVIARESGSTEGNNPSSVRFSEEGDPEDFTADNFVDLDPGDGEAISGVVSWREYVFVFKPSKVFVLYAETTDATGQPVFLFKKVDTGIGAIASKAIASARDGVYFLSRTGVYRMTGPGAPVPVSRQVDPLFLNSLSSFYQGDEISQASITGSAMHFHNERLYIAVPTGVSTTNNRMLVYDPRFGEWLDWNIPAAALTTFSIGDSPELVFARPAGSNYIDRHSSSYTDDDGTAIASRYRTGFYDLGMDVEKIAKELVAWGTGTVSFKMSRDFGALDTARTLTLGTSPAIDRDVTNCAATGHVLSHEFSATSGAWRVYRAAIGLMPPKPAGSKTP